MFDREYYNRKQKEKYWSNPYLANLNGKEVRHLVKIKVLGHYSNPQGIPVCNNCGEQDIDVLCIDHIKGGGQRHLDEIKARGYGFYQWLKRNHYPKDYQVLCCNCNNKKARIQ